VLAPGSPPVRGMRNAEAARGSVGPSPRPSDEQKTHTAAVGPLVERSARKLRFRCRSGLFREGRAPRRARRGLRFLLRINVGEFFGVYGLGETPVHREESRARDRSARGPLDLSPALPPSSR
jgi:hypothetical protein